MQSKKELHRDRPPPLKIHRSAAPGPSNVVAGAGSFPGQGRPPHHHNNAIPYRQPVIIHTYSPEIIMTDTRNFRQLVQRLTGSETSDESQADMPASQGRKRPRPAPEHTHQAEQPTAQRQRVNPDPSRIRSNSYTDNQPDLSMVKADPDSNPSDNSSIQGTHQPYSHLNGQYVMNPNTAAENQAPYCHHPGKQHNPTHVLPPSSHQKSSGTLSSPSSFNFDLSPSILPSPSQFAMDFPSLCSPQLTASVHFTSPARMGPTHPPLLSPISSFLQAAGNHNYSPGPFSVAGSFMAELPALSATAYSLMERNNPDAEATYASRPLATPPDVRPPPTTTANLFPVPPPPRPL